MTEGRFETSGNVVFLAPRDAAGNARGGASQALVCAPTAPSVFPGWFVILVGTVFVLPAAFVALTAWFVSYLGFLCLLIGAIALPDLARRSVRRSSPAAGAVLTLPMAGIA